MASKEDHALWGMKGETLSDKTAQKEFGLTQQEIMEAIRAGKLQYRHTTLFGNPSLRLLRTELESLVKERYGSEAFKTQKTQHELRQINSELRSLKRKVTTLEKKKAELLGMLGS